MKKKKAVSPHRVLQYIILSFFIVFGFISIIATGGGDDGAPPKPSVVDNSSFYGDYAISMTTDSCKIDNFIATIGDDSTRQNEDGYLYLPKDQSSVTWSQPDRTFTLERSGQTIIYSEDGQDYTAEHTFVFSDDYDSFTLTGWTDEDNPDECDGNETGTGIRVGTVGVTIGTNYLQYRTFSTSNQYRGWVELSKDGIPIEESEIQNIEISNSDGAVNINTPLFYPVTWFTGTWNSQSGSVDFSGPYSYSGFLISFPEGVDLPADDYTWEFTTSDDEPLSEQINYPGQETLPLVTGLQSEWQEDEDGQGYSLILSWTNPAGDYDQLVVYINNQGQFAGDMMSVTLPVTVNEITIPSDWVQTLGDFYDIIIPRWQVQTRSYTAENMNYARGYSDWALIPAPPDAQ